MNLNLVPLSELFDVVYGNKFDLCNMPAADADYVNFVSRTAYNNGVSARVGRVPGAKPYPAGCITVALGGAILSSFTQVSEFYTAQNVAVLRPKTSMSLGTLLYYCAAISANKFRYSAFGREANRTLRTLLVPPLDAVPLWANAALPAEKKSLAAGLASFTEENIDTAKPERMKSRTVSDLLCVHELFDITRGTNLDLNALQQVDDGIPYISCTGSNNGVLAKVAAVPGVEPLPAGCLTVALVGNAMASFIQEKPFYSAQNIAILTPREPMTQSVLLYYAACLRLNQFRFSYGRKANRTMKNLFVPAPQALPSWVEGSISKCAANLTNRLHTA